MFSLSNLFNKKKQPSKWPEPDDEDSGPETRMDAIKMTLEERKEYREQMLRKAIQDAFSSYQIVSGMYRYRFMALDERAHYFIVMIDTTRHFALSKHKTTNKLAQIEETIKKIAFNSFNIIVEGVYWKANETVEVFENVKEYSIPSNRPRRPIEEIARDFKDTAPGWSDSAYGERDRREVDGKTYDTDISPLGPQ
jgi:predicted  nucleic acid-binding Zn-ribbon protein